MATRRAKAFLTAVDTIAGGLSNQMFADMYREAVRRKMEGGDSALFDFLGCLEKTPVSIEEFIDGPEFLGATDFRLWPEVRNAAVAINSRWWEGGDAAHNEAVLKGATGTGKTSIAIVTMLYHVYLLHCLKNPQGLYGFPKATSIVFAIMGAKPRVVNKVIYLPMRKLVESMPHFQKHIRPDKLIESEMFFREKNIRIAQSGGDEDAILGEAIIGGIVDEINFMNVVLRSKKAEVSTGRAGLYDQAEQVFSTMQRRKRGRFTRPGPTIGIVIASSSTRYRNDFTDKRAKFIKENGIKTAYIYSPKQYDVVPAERFSGKKFKLVIGNEVYHDTRVLRDDEAMPEGAWVEEVPIEYLDDFLNRPYDALRDVLGLSNNAISPFIKSRHKIYECVEAGNEIGLTSILLKDHVILGEDGMPQVKQGTYCMNPSRPRYVHIDLSRNADRCGISMVRFEGMRQVKRQNSMSELLPIAVVELACTITPDANNEIDVAEVRAFVMHLKKKYGYPIKGVSYDGVDSRESIQAWRKDGMRATMISVDRFSAPYKQLRDAMYDTRVLLPDDELLMTEIIDLEFDETKDHVDHPVNGCFIGDTLIRMPNGGTISFEAAARSKSIPVVTYDSGHVPSTGIRPRVTKNVTTLVCVTLATGAEIHCTPEHRFLLTSGEYKEAQHLTEIDDLQG